MSYLSFLTTSLFISGVIFVLYSLIYEEKEEQKKQNDSYYKQIITKTITVSYCFSNRLSQSLYCEAKNIDNFNKNIKINKYGYPVFIDSNILVHRWVMEKKLKRKLKPEEVVHHKDGNKRNFKLENLMLFENQRKHENHHLKNFMQFGYWYDINKCQNIGLNG